MFHIVLAKVPLADSSFLGETRLAKMMPPMISNKISGPSCSQFRRVVYGLFFLLPILQIEGCYYMQAARGQIDIMHKRRPVDEVIQDTDSSDALKERLVLVNAARQFSIDELFLPDNESYRSYADLERDYVVWNVFAAPEFSLHPRQWCYPVAGCVSYRGYFSQEAAERQAGKLRPIRAHARLAPHRSNPLHAVRLPTKHPNRVDLGSLGRPQRPDWPSIRQPHNGGSDLVGDLGLHSKSVPSLECGIC